MESANETRNPHSGLYTRLLVYSVLSVCMMAFVFYMSAQPGGESSSMSDAVAHVIASFFAPGWNDMNPIAQQQAWETLTFVIRKTAHATEYALLSAFVCAALRHARALRLLKRSGNASAVSIPPWKTALLGTIVCVVYAATDELHQLFVPGRTGLATDVLVDASGIVVAAVACTLFARWRVRAKAATRESVLRAR